MPLAITALSAPTGITITGTILKKLDLETTDKAVEEADSTGRFVEGFSQELQTVGTLSAKAQDDASLPTAGSGANTASSPRITSVKTSQDESGKSVDVGFKYAAAGTGDY